MVPDERIIKVFKEEGIVTIHEAMELTGLHYSTIISRIIRGGLPAIKLGAGNHGIWLIRLSLLKK